jgi:DNA-directed RNA polymerase specialized sigma24 family protein
MELGSDTVSSLRRRDPEAIGTVVRDNARPLYRVARGAGFSAGGVDDLTQDVFTTFLETLDRFEGRSQIRTWLFGILHRKCSNVRVHVLLCRHCRRFARQMRQLGTVSRLCRDSLEPDASDGHFEKRVIRALTHERPSGRGAERLE